MTCFITILDVTLTFLLRSPWNDFIIPFLCYSLQNYWIQANGIGLIGCNVQENNMPSREQWSQWSCCAVWPGLRIYDHSCSYSKKHLFLRRCDYCIQDMTWLNRCKYEAAGDKLQTLTMAYMQGKFIYIAPFSTKQF